MFQVLCYVVPTPTTQDMIVLNSMTESATLGEIVIQTLPAGNVAVDRRNGQGHRLTSTYDRMYLALQKPRQLARRRAFGTTALMSGEYVLVGYGLS